MKEKIILVPGLNANEFVKSLAAHGVNCIGLRICNAAELARMALARSGITISETFISGREEVSLIAEAARDVTYFTNASYADIRGIAASIRKMRMLVTDSDEGGVIKDNLSKGIFTEKNDALLSIYDRYIRALKANNLVDSVALIRKAIGQCPGWDADFTVLKEYPLYPLEKALIDKLSGSNTAEVGIKALFGIDNDSTTGPGLKVDDIKECYGASTEVESIISDIYSGCTLDQCTVAVADVNTYSQLFFDIALRYDIPISFGCGIPVTNSYPARLLSLYREWITSGFFGADSVDAMLSSEAFNRTVLKGLIDASSDSFDFRVFSDIVKNLRLTNDAEDNKRKVSDLETTLKKAKDTAADEKKREEIQKKLDCVPFVRAFAADLAGPVEDFIRKYAYLRKDGKTNAGKLVTVLDASASSALYDELRSIRLACSDRKVDEIITSALKSTVCCQETSAGKIHLTGIGDAFSCVRKNLFVAGLAASAFPGSPTENYLLLDDDLRRFGDQAGIYLSDNIVERKKQSFFSLIELASALGSRVSVSYSGFNTAELKADNPSSVIMDVMEKKGSLKPGQENGNAQIRKVLYFDPQIGSSRLIGREYMQNHVIHQDDVILSQEEQQAVLDAKEYSPSSLDTFFECNRKFYIKFILNIREPEKTNPFDVISPKDAGILAHDILKQQGILNYDHDTFIRLSAEQFDDFIKTHPPLIKENAASKKAEFLSMMENAYNLNPQRKIITAEEEMHGKHFSGLSLHGYPDRVEMSEDGTCLIVDFKTGKTKKHKENDVKSCLQTVIYAFLMEQNEIRVSGCEYRYLKLGLKVPCRYDDAAREEMDGILSDFSDRLKAGQFPVTEIKKNCKNCGYSGMCGKNTWAEDESDD